MRIMQLATGKQLPISIALRNNPSCSSTSTDSNWHFSVVWNLFGWLKLSEAWWWWPVFAFVATLVHYLFLALRKPITLAEGKEVLNDQIHLCIGVEVRTYSKRQVTLDFLTLLQLELKIQNLSHLRAHRQMRLPETVCVRLGLSSPRSAAIRWLVVVRRSTTCHWKQFAPLCSVQARHSCHTPIRSIQNSSTTMLLCDCSHFQGLAKRPAYRIPTGYIHLVEWVQMAFIVNSVWAGALAIVMFVILWKSINSTMCQNNLNP